MHSAGAPRMRRLTYLVGNCRPRLVELNQAAFFFDGTFVVRISRTVP